MNDEKPLLPIKRFERAWGDPGAFLEFFVSPVKAWDSIDDFVDHLPVSNLCNEETLNLCWFSKHIVTPQDEHFKKMLGHLNEENADHIILKPRYETKECWVLANNFPSFAVMWIEDNNYYAICWDSSS